MTVILFWFFPSIVVKDHRLQSSGSCPDFVTLLLNAFVMIVEVPPTLYLDFHGISVLYMTNWFHDQKFLTSC